MTSVAQTSSVQSAAASQKAWAKSLDMHRIPRAHTPLSGVVKDTPVPSFP